VKFGRLFTKGSITAGICVLVACVAPVAPASRVVPMLDGMLKVGLAKGYCIDRSTSREGRDMAVILMGRCRNDAAVPAAVISLSAGTDGSARVLAAGGQEMAAFFRSKAGRATLSSNGKADSLEVIAAIGVEDAFLLHLNDAANGEYWRGILPISNRLVTISAVGTQQTPLAPEDGRKAVEQTIDAMRLANAKPATLAGGVTP
jgi:hypothetical protein